MHFRDDPLVMDSGSAFMTGSPLPGGLGKVRHDAAPAFTLKKERPNKGARALISTFANRTANVPGAGYRFAPTG